LQASGAGNNATQGSYPIPQPAPTVINIEPHPQIMAKKKEVLHDLAMQKHAVQEAKGSHGV